MILVIGNISYDLFLICDPSRPLILIESAGGKGANQALAATKYLAKKNAVDFISIIGNDFYGRQTLNLLNAKGLNIGNIQCIAGTTPTNLLRVPPGGNTALIPIYPNLRMRILKHNISALIPKKKYKYAILQNKIHPLTTEDLIKHFDKTDTKIVVNWAPPGGTFDKSVYEKIDWLIVNEDEATEVCKQLRKPFTTPLNMLEIISSELKVNAVITLSSKGCIAKEAKLPPHYTGKPFSVTQKDKTGSGDAFVGVFIAAIASGEDIQDALDLASIAGALTCKTVGSQTANLSSKNLAKLKK